MWLTAKQQKARERRRKRLAQVQRDQRVAQLMAERYAQVPSWWETPKRQG